MKKINLPNKLTILRILLTPLVVFFMLWDRYYAVIPALLIFIIASVTDFFDGKIARSRNLVTDFGKFLDPIADKIIVISIMVCLIPKGFCSPVAVILVLFREFIVSSLRLTAASHSIVLAAGIWGKIKTAFQMFSLTAVLVLLSINVFAAPSFDIQLVSNILMWLNAAIAVFSGVDYLIKNAKLINPCE